MHVHLVDYIPWIGSLIAEALLIASMLRRRLIRQLPFFFCSIAFDALRAVALPAIGFANVRTYSYGFWVLVPVEYTLAFAVIVEVFLHTFQAQKKYSPRAVRGFVALSAVLIVLSIVLVFYPDVPTDTPSGLVLTLDRSTKLLRCGILAFIWIFASRLAISWRNHVWGIVLGFGLYSGISLMVAAVEATTGKLCGDSLTYLLPYSYFAATAIWTGYLSTSEPERGSLTPQQIQLFSEVIAGYRKLANDLWRAMHDRY
jgi:hypothetical protein